MADETETDRGDGGAEHATRKRMDDCRRQNHRKHRKRGVAQGAEADGRNGDAADETLRAGGVDQRTARNLSNQRDETGGREHEADIDLCPFLRGEEDRYEWSETGLHIGDKKDEPIKATQTAR